MTVTFDQAKEVKNKHASTLLTLQNCNGVGLTTMDGEWVIKISFSKETTDDIPTELDGVKIKSEIIGEIRFL